MDILAEVTFLKNYKIYIFPSYMMQFNLKLLLTRVGIFTVD